MRPLCILLVFSLNLLNDNCGSASYFRFYQITSFCIFFKFAESHASLSCHLCKSAVFQPGNWPSQYSLPKQKNNLQPSKIQRWNKFMNQSLWFAKSLSPFRGGQPCRIWHPPQRFIKFIYFLLLSTPQKIFRYKLFHFFPTCWRATCTVSCWQLLIHCDGQLPILQLKMFINIKGW